MLVIECYILTFIDYKIDNTVSVRINDIIASSDNIVKTPPFL